MPENEELQETPLHASHLRAGAKMVGFAGWHMPVLYSSVMEEHRAVRTAAGLFDVSHMGEIRVAGPGAEAFLEALTPNHVAKLIPGRAHYSGLLTEQGTYIDDLLVYRLAQEEFLLVVNAANAAADYSWIAERAGPGVEVEDVSERYALIAFQGPKSQELLQPLTPVDLDALKYYRFQDSEVDGSAALVSRTGYTGEDGFELYVAPAAAAGVWDTLLAVGADAGCKPAGLGARDTLRLEAAMALYGHELDQVTTPYEAGLNWVVKLEKGEFLGRDALVTQKEKGVDRKLAGFEVTDRGIARQGHEVFANGAKVGKVTSGTWSPTLEKAIGMTYLPAELAEVGTELSIAVRKRELPALVTELPFYRRKKR